MTNAAPAAPAAPAPPAPDATILSSAGATPPGGDAKPSGAPNAPANGQPAAAAQPNAGTPDPSKPTTPDAAKTPQGAPEKYADFKLPDGMTLDSKLDESFKSIAKELNLTQDGAQKLVDLQAQSVVQAIEQAGKDFKQQQESWKAETNKALGANREAELAFAAKGRDQFATPALQKLLSETGLGDHPDVVKLFVSLGKAVGEDKFVDGKGSGTPEKDPAKVLYGGKPK